MAAKGFGVCCCVRGSDVVGRFVICWCGDVEHRHLVGALALMFQQKQYADQTEATCEHKEDAETDEQVIIGSGGMKDQATS